VLSRGPQGADETVGPLTIIFQFLVRISMVVFLPLVLASGLGHPLGSWMLQYMSWMVVLLLPPLFLVLVFTTFVEKEEMDEPATRAKYGNIYMETKYYRTSSAVNIVVWLVRRILFMAIFWIDNYTARIVLQLMLQVVILSYYGWERPFHNPSVLFIEIFNEVCVTILFCILFAFMNTEYTAIQQDSFGWFFIAIICILCAVNSFWLIHMFCQGYQDFLTGRLGFNIVVPLPDPIPLLEYKKYKDLESYDGTEIPNKITVDMP
jgi:hypothetical protein